METVDVLLPRPAATPAPWSGARALHAVGGARVAIVNNGWGSSDDFAPVLERVLRADYGVADVVHFRNKGHSAEVNSCRMSADDPSRGASAAFVHDVVERADVVLTMLGN